MSTAADQTKSKMKAEAKKLHAMMVKLGPAVRQSAMELGLYAHQMKEGNMWPLVGSADENSYRQSLKIGRSTWYRYIRIREGLKKVPAARFLRLIAENAEHLLRLPETERIKDEWLKRAETMKEEEFEKLIVKQIAKEEGVEEEDVRVWWKLKMLASQKDLIDSVIKEFCQKHNIDPARALEFIAIEAKNSPRILAAIQQTVPPLRAAWGGLDLGDSPGIKAFRAAFMNHLEQMANAAGVQLSS